jgi:hypothetical protein
MRINAGNGRDIGEYSGANGGGHRLQTNKNKTPGHEARALDSILSLGLSGGRP